jgi:hypothetical protein
MSEATRAYIYRVSLAVLVVAVAFGLITDETQVTAIAGLLLALTGNGLASLNTTTKSVPPPPEG